MIDVDQILTSEAQNPSLAPNSVGQGTSGSDNSEPSPLSPGLHFPHVIDSTILSTWRSCPQKAFRQYFQHWKPKGESVHLVAGGAFASGIEAARRAFYEQGASSGDSEAAGLKALIEKYGNFDCPPDSAKSLERVCGALEFYLDKYPLGADGATPITTITGTRGIEFSFAEPLEIKHPETGDPIIYAGRADMVAEFAGGVYGFDEKTTSSLGAQWHKQWEMRSQFTGYVWAGRRANIEMQGVIVRGVSILKTKYDHQQVVCGRSQYEVDRWESELYRSIQQMIQYFSEAKAMETIESSPPYQSAFPYNLDHACAEYGGCSFVPVCKSPNPEVWLPMYFEQKVWDPIGREELTPAQWNAKWARST